MRKNFKKGICAMSLAAMLAASVTACGSKTTDATTAESTESVTTEATTSVSVDDAETTVGIEEGEALTEDEYLAKAEELANSMVETTTKVSSEIDPSDVEGAKKLIEELKTPFIEFADVVAPEKYADAQAKYKSGCEAMVEYLNICLEMMDMGTETETASEEDAQALTDRLTKALTAVQADFTEAATLMAGAEGVSLEESVEETTETEAAN